MSPKTYKIAVLPGDGIGPEIIAQASRILKIISDASSDFKLQLDSYDFGGCAIDSTGNPLPSTTLKACQEADAILFGAIGGPKWGVHSPVRPEQGLLELRKTLGLYANIRPANFASDSLVSDSPIKADIVKGTDIVVVRELIGGAYFGKRKEQGVEPDADTAWDTTTYSVSEVERITHVAANIALAADPPLMVHSIDKANVLASSRLWRKVVTEVLTRDYPQLQFDHQYVDSAAMVMVANPRKLNGVLLTENLFGDILSDQSSVIPGSLGLLPSASLAGSPSLATNKSGTTLGLYEPIHGSAPDIAGKGIANPIGTILSAAMMLKYSLGLYRAAQIIESSVKKVLDSPEQGGFGLRTADLGGSATTQEISDRIVEVVKSML